MKKYIELIENIFKEMEWKYDYREDNNVFISGVNSNEMMGNLKMFIFMEENSCNVYWVFGHNVEKSYLPTVSEFLHRANFGLKDGNFEMDYDDGEIKYKTFVNFLNSDVSKEVLQRTMFIGVQMFKQYAKGLLKVMLGDEKVKECIEMCEGEEEQGISM